MNLTYKLITLSLIACFFGCENDNMKDEITKEDVVVVIFHDHGTRYVGKLFNDDWMKEMKFL